MCINCKQTGEKLKIKSHPGVLELLEVDVEVGPYAVHGSREGDAADQQDEENHVGHSGCDVHHLGVGGAEKAEHYQPRLKPSHYQLLHRGDCSQKGGSFELMAPVKEIAPIFFTIYIISLSPHVTVLLHAHTTCYMLATHVAIGTGPPGYPSLK